MHKIIFFTTLLMAVLLASSCHSPSASSNGIDRTSQNKKPAIESTAYRYTDADVVKRCYLDSRGHMWFATTREGVYRYDGDTFTNISMADGLCSNMVDAITEDDRGLMWFGTAKGLCSYDGTAFTHIPLPQEEVQSISPETGLPSRTTEAILSLVHDGNGDFWIGTDASGAYKYDGTAFTSYLRFEGRVQPNDNLYNNCIPNIIEDSKGHIWLGSFTHGGLTEVIGDTMIHHALKDGHGDGMVSTSYMDRRGHLWFGTRNSGVYKYDGQSFENVVDGKTGESVPMACIVEDRSGTIWMGSFARRGVYTYDGASITLLDMTGSEHLNDIKCIALDKEGSIWFGGRYGLLWRYEGGQLTDFTELKRG